MKLTAIATAILMALVALAPLGYAGTTSTADADDDGHLSRTFLYQGSIDWKPHSQIPGDEIGGVGWYDPDDRNNLCMFRLFGLSIGSGFYYDTLRVTTNIGNTHVATVPETGIFPGSIDPALNCPTNPGATPGQFLGTSAFNLWLGGQISQSNLLCFKTFLLCNPDPDTARWWLFDCNGYSGDAVKDKKNDNQVVFGHGDLLGLGELIGNLPGGQNVAVGSSHIVSGCDPATDNHVKGFDVTTSLDPQLNNLASLHDVHVDQIVPVGRNTTYVMSCYSVEYQVFRPGIGLEDEKGVSHDYFLVLADGDEDNWLPALQYHAAAPAGAASDKYPTNSGYTPNSVAMQGVYDLSGNNDCPVTDAPTDLVEDKGKDNPLIP